MRFVSVPEEIRDGNAKSRQTDIDDILHCAQELRTGFGSWFEFSEIETLGCEDGLHNI